MATRMKTVQYAFPALASLVNNTLTTLTQITISLPENSKVFRSVVAKLSCDDIITATGGTITTKNMNLRLGAAAYTTTSNADTITNSGENFSLFWSRNFTNHFVANWTGTSMTCDFQVQLNQTTGTTTGFVNVCVTLEITYEYDDTSATQIKTIYYPLNCPSGAMPTAAATQDTIPALSTLLPEASKVFRDIFVVIQGNEHNNGATVDHTMTLRVGAASVTTGNYEAALASDRFTRYVWKLLAAYPNTAAAQNWQPTASVATRRHHQQAYLVVTYEYNEAATTRVFNSVMVPAFPDAVGVAANPTIVRAQLTSAEEPNPSSEKIAFYGFFASIAAITGLSATCDGGAVVTSYTDVASNLCGSNAFMYLFSDSTGWVGNGPGASQINFEIWETGATVMFDVSGFFIICYSSDKSPQGTSAHNHTILFDLIRPAGVLQPSSPETLFYPTSLQFSDDAYFLTCFGFEVDYQFASNPASGVIKVLQGNDAGGLSRPRPVFSSGINTDPENGMFPFFYDATNFFRRFYEHGSLRDFSLSDRLDISASTPLFSATYLGMSGAGRITSFIGLQAIVTLHHIHAFITGTLTGATGDVQVQIFPLGGNPESPFLESGTYVTAPATSYSARTYAPASEHVIIASDFGTTPPKITRGQGFAA